MHAPIEAEAHAPIEAEARAGKCPPRTHKKKGKTINNLLYNYE